MYGRERDVAALLAAFERVVLGGPPELVLVSGYSGIGKSSLVHELHKVLVPPRGLFASGKFDQYKRDIPYATLAQAFQSLVRDLLARSDAELAPWRDALREALGPNGRLVTGLVPELALILGEQPEPPALQPEAARARFQLVFRRFIGVFARAEHPLALFLDDLQWLDEATLDLLEDLLAQPELRHLMLIGAYRDNEVGPSHPLMRKLQSIREGPALLHDIVLTPLAAADLAQLIADSLHCDAAQAAPLAALVHARTSGNPFFAIQFLSSLFEEGMLGFDHAGGRWSWDLDRIEAKGYTDNVVDLMVGKLARLAPQTQEALKQLACLGNRAEFAMVGAVCQDSPDEMHAQLAEAVRASFILHAKDAYHFLHDRVQEAAYSLIPEDLRAGTHLRIGRVMAAHTPAGKREERIFEIVNQFNRGLHLITSTAERERVAGFNLVAGRRAKTSTAYASALRYLRAGRELLTEEAWHRQPDLVFALECLLAECELLTADMAAAESRLAALAARARTAHDIARVASLRLTLYTAVDRSDRAVDIFLDYWRGCGTDWSAHPTEAQALREYERIWALLAGREVEELLDLPLMTDAAVLDVLDVFTGVVAPALYTDPELLALVICRMVSLSLEHGNCDASCYAYVFLGMLAGPRFGNYPVGYRFGKLGHDLVEKRGLQRYRARAFMDFGTLVIPWTKHVKTGRELQRRAFDVANKAGDLTYAAYSCNVLYTNLLAGGEPLPDVYRETEMGLAFATQARMGLVVDVISTQRALIRTLRGMTPTFGTFDEEGFDEGAFERHLAGSPWLALGECWYWVRKLQARVFAGDPASAVAASVNAKRLLWTSPAFFEAAEYHFYGALARAAAADAATGDARLRHLEALAAHQEQQDAWARHGPENFENRRWLVGAEIARIEGRELEAERLYEAAIRSAREHGFVQNEALAYELAARFQLTRGFEDFGAVYLRRARHAYLRWGADGKVRQLERAHPQLREQESAPGATSTMGAPVEQLDLATVIKVSQAVSSEIVLEKMLDTLMRTAIEHAGAERGLLILSRAGEQRVVAEAAGAGAAVSVQVCDQAAEEAVLAQSVLHYVWRTREGVTLDDASAQGAFAADPGIRARGVRSVLCLPLLNQAKLIGVLYLENNLAPGVFVPARLAVLKLLASEAAISLENTRLYRELAKREARMRRLVDANIIGIFMWDITGRINDANDAFLRMIGYEREDLARGVVRWTDLTPPSWREVDIRDHVPELKATGTLYPFEKEYFRKDGSRVPVMVGVTAFEEGGSEGVAFVLDLSERKRAEAEARDSERRYHEMEMRLADTNRIASIAHLSASVAHELNQPLAGIMANASTCLRRLAADPPKVAGATEAARRVIRDADRASEIIQHLRALFGRREIAFEWVDLNEAAREVIALSSPALQKDRVDLQCEFDADLRLVKGDRIQLQQVIMNLLRNAADAMRNVADRPRQLAIRTLQSADGRVQLTVRDTGVGLDAADVEKLFEAFYTTKSSGMGIGLSVSRSIVERHHGQLWGEPNDGPGASFSFTIPAPPDAGERTR
ncbi:trifunctional serine/threonine-protein kinase/ATP-binding protein/sensor histidine kinase [Streptococcus pyogenes]|uniref:trifunctional serine/threonine-protein kinase/ATP-binding protein/sensor histidine kinase n=1 Tax=Streptococcus pyogenes TaxID=1314 RepID=UPI003DA022D8